MGNEQIVVSELVWRRPCVYWRGWGAELRKKYYQKTHSNRIFHWLKKDNGKWKWLSNQTTVDSSKGKSPWAPGQPSRTSKKEKANCAIIYGKYGSYLGRFDDDQCREGRKSAGYICEKTVSCTKHEKGRSLFVEESVLEDQEQASSVFSSSYWVLQKRKTNSPPHPLLLHKRKLPQLQMLQSYGFWNLGGDKGIYRSVVDNMTSKVVKNLLCVANPNSTTVSLTCNWWIVLFMFCSFVIVVVFVGGNVS